MARAHAKSATKRRKTGASAAAATPERPLKIGEAARVIGVEAYVLRFWETQFPILRPRHSRSRHRFYEREDIETLKLIKRLLHTEGFTIAGAKKHIREIGLDRLRSEVPPAETAATRNESTPIHASPPAALQRTLAEIRNDLKSLHKLLEN